MPAPRALITRAGAASALNYISDRSAHLLAGAFVVYGLLFAGWFTFHMPPFQNADEVAHFLRVAQIGEGQLIGIRFGHDKSGGPVDRGILTTAIPFIPIAFHPEVKVNPSLYAADPGWTGEHVWLNFGNTSIYSPVLYLPAVAGVWIGQAMHLKILPSLYLARLGNALVAITLAGLGLRLAGRTAPYLFLVLALPMSLALMANASQDGVMDGCVTIAAGLVAASRQRPTDMANRNTANRTLVMVSLALAAVCMGRPPYAPLAIIPLLLPGVRRGPRVLAAALILLACAAWSAFAAVTAVVPLQPDVPAINPAGQLRWILVHPGETVLIVLDSAYAQSKDLAAAFVAGLGWLDVSFPPRYVEVVEWLLPIAAVLSLDGGDDAETGRRRIMVSLSVAAAILASGALICLGMFLTWTKVGSAPIAGLQGRYFLPLALAATVMLPGLPGLPRRWGALRGALIVGVMLFPIVSLVVTMHAVEVRYYPP
jgi:hypothetical protein